VAGPREIVGAGVGADGDLDVRARSAAEMPVVTPSRASIDSVKAVPKREVLSCVMGPSRM
jgi:maleate cis-trans isomerase